MARAFASGFSGAFGPPWAKGQLVLMTGAHPTYEDGDVLFAPNRRRIRCVHAEHICHVKHVAFNSDGLNPLDSLPDVFLRNVYQYMFQRISATEVRRTDLGTLAEVVISGTPTLIDGRMQSMDVAAFVARRKQHARHRLFGTSGAEVWYGGRIDASHTKLDLVWSEVEARTAHREQDFPDWPATPREMSRFLVIDVEDFDDAAAGDLTAPLLDDTDPENPVEVKRRKHTVAWRGLRDVVEADVLDFGLPVDIRGRKHARSLIVGAKA